MPAPKSAHYVFPDFQSLIDRLVISRSSIETDRALVEKARSGLTPTDIRLATYAHLYHEVNFAIVSLRILDAYLTKEEWWREPEQQALFGDYDLRYTEAIANNFNNGEVKYAFLHKPFGTLENTLRQLLRKIDATAANNATESIEGVFGALMSRIGNKPADSDDLVKLVRLCRNTIHNNGVFYPKSQTDDQVTYKGTTYRFTHGKPINFVNWDFLIDRLDDVRQLLTTVILNPQIIGISDEIPDMFGANRVTVKVTP
jgi:hypothetical protein